jgi:hypothetical protein
MKIIPIEHLPLHQPLHSPLFHPCGEILLEAGKLFTTSDFEELQRSGVSQVIQLGIHDNIFQFRSQSKVKTLHIDEVTPQHRLSFPLFLPSGKLLFGSTLHLTSEQCQLAKSLHIHYVLVEKTSTERDLDSYQKFLNRHQNPLAPSKWWKKKWLALHF